MKITSERECRKCRTLFSGVRCRECQRVANAKRYQLFAEQRKAAAKFYRDKDIERYRGYSRKWIAENKESHKVMIKEWRDANPERSAEIVRQSNARQRDRLSDAYVASSLGLPINKIAPTLIETQRIHLQIFRLLKAHK